MGTRHGACPYLPSGGSFQAGSSGAPGGQDGAEPGLHLAGVVRGQSSAPWPHIRVLLWPRAQLVCAALGRSLGFPGPQRPRP